MSRRGFVKRFVYVLNYILKYSHIFSHTHIGINPTHHIWSHNLAIDNPHFGIYNVISIICIWILDISTIIQVLLLFFYSLYFELNGHHLLCTTKSFKNKFYLNLFFYLRATNNKSEKFQTYVYKCNIPIYFKIVFILFRFLFMPI